MNDDEVLYIHIRSSLGIKYNLQLTNGTGIIDSIIIIIRIMKENPN